MSVVMGFRNSKLLHFSVLALAFALAAGAQADVAKVLETCAGCHGKDGASTTPEAPIIGGFSSTSLAESLANYKIKARPCLTVKYNAGAQKGQSGDMCTVAAALSEAEVKEVSDYLSKKPFVRATQTPDAAKAAKGKQIHDTHCAKCHTDGGGSADDDAGILAGQWMEYLRHTFEEYKSGKRPQPKKMKPKVDPLTANDLEALVNYYGSFK